VQSGVQVSQVQVVVLQVDPAAQLSSQIAPVPQPSSPQHLLAHWTSWLQVVVGLHFLVVRSQNSFAAQSALDEQPVSPEPPQWIKNNPRVNSTRPAIIQVRTFFIFFLLHNGLI